VPRFFFSFKPIEEEEQSVLKNVLDVLSIRFRKTEANRDAALKGGKIVFPNLEVIASLQSLKNTQRKPIS
jgi:hypothetical protein